MTTRTTTRVTAGIALTMGAIAEVSAVTFEHVPAAIAGLASVVVGATAIAIRIIEAAVRDTADERRRLLAAEADASAEYARLLAARAQLDIETERVLRAAEAAERRCAAGLQAERERLYADIEDRRAELKMEGYLTALKHSDRGLHSLPVQAQPRDAQVINLPAR